MKILSIILLAALFISCDEPAKMIWHDNFATDGVPNPSKWTYELGDGCPELCGWGNNERQAYTSDPQNVRVEDGNLIIEAIQISAEDSTYTSAKLVSHSGGSWQYAYVEIRAKLPVGRGTWPALWMLPDEKKYGGWPKSGEIDIMEHVGMDQDVVHGTVHTEAYNGMIGTQVGKQIDVAGASEDFHVYAIDWTADNIAFMVDGEVYHNFPNDDKGTAEWPFDHPFHLIINIAVGGNWGGQQGIDKTVWPQQMLVDYVRVYDKKPG